MPRGRPPVQGLTDRQQVLMQYLQETIQSQGHSPTLRQIGQAVGIGSANGVLDHLKKLEDKGYIRRGYYVHRGILLLKDLDGQSSPQTEARQQVRVPLMETPALDSSTGDLLFDQCVLPSDTRDLFAWQVGKLRQLPGGISPGDTLIVRRQQALDDGDFGLVRLGRVLRIVCCVYQGNRLRRQRKGTEGQMGTLRKSELEGMTVLGKIVRVYHLL